MTETAPRHLLILGSTGSIGRQALEVAETLPQVEVVGLAAGSSVDLLLEQASACGARAVCLRDAKAAAEAAARAPGLAVLAGEGGLRELISRAAERAGNLEEVMRIAEELTRLGRSIARGNSNGR